MVAAQHQRAALARQLRHRVAHRARRLRVEARRGLVEEDDLRLVQQRTHAGQLLPHALAEAAHRLVFAPAQPEALEIAALIRRVAATGTTVVLVEHNMRLVMGVSDHILVLDHGRRLAEGTAEQVRHDPRVIEAYLGAVTQASTEDTGCGAAAPAPGATEAAEA